MKVSYITVSAAILICLLCSCSSKEKPNTAAETVPETESGADAAEVQKLPPPPGNPGPVIMRISDRLPSQIFAAAADDSHLTVAYQSDARDVSLCTESNLPFCFLGMAAIAERMNPNQVKTVKLYESDTQSGARLDDAASVNGKFAFAVIDGIYVGDTQKASLALVDKSGKIDNILDLNQIDSRIGQIALSLLDDGRLLICRAIDPVLPKKTPTARIICEYYDAVSNRRTPAGTVHSEWPVHSIAAAAHGNDGLIAWTQAGNAKAAFLSDLADVIDLGPSTAARPLIASGLNAFAVAWQADDGNMHIERIGFEKKQKNRQSLVLNGIQNRTLNGLAAVSEGFVFAFRHRNTQQIGIVSEDFSGWNLVENSVDWRMFAGYGSLNLQDAHTGTLVWQTAESLVQPK